MLGHHDQLRPEPEPHLTYTAVVYVVQLISCTLLCARLQYTWTWTWYGTAEVIEHCTLTRTDNTLLRLQNDDFFSRYTALNCRGHTCTCVIRSMPAPCPRATATAVQLHSGGASGRDTARRLHLPSISRRRCAWPVLCPPHAAVACYPCSSS